MEHRFTRPPGNVDGSTGYTRPVPGSHVHARLQPGGLIKRRLYLRKADPHMRRAPALELIRVATRGRKRAESGVLLNPQVAVQNAPDAQGGLRTLAFGVAGFGVEINHPALCGIALQLQT